MPMAPKGAVMSVKAMMLQLFQFLSFALFTAEEDGLGLDAAAVVVVFFFSSPK